MSSDKAVEGAHQLSDEQRIQWIEQTLNSLAEVYGGRAFSGELQLTIEDRPVRMTIDETWLTPSFEARMENRRGFFIAIWEEGAAPPESQPGDAWADKRDDDRYFVAPECYLPSELFVSVAQSLPANVLDDLAAFMSANKIVAVTITDSLKFQSIQDLCVVENLQETIDNFCRMASRMVNLFEGADTWVGMQPGISIGGQMAGQSSGVTVSCEYCNTLAMLNASSSCPTCGAPLTRSPQ